VSRPYELIELPMPSRIARAEATDQLELKLEEPAQEEDGAQPTATETDTEEKWVCPICDESFRLYPAANARHRRACERRQREEIASPHVCPHCGRRFRSLQALRSHLGRTHPDV
ncbi:MAG: C2H2-type zinc finger protein, partial [Candidatus Poribacteria bacterium]|nr:C2H2-type zinc finger protein [Candidatus Poribacteria bacterium]